MHASHVLDSSMCLMRASHVLDGSMCLVHASHVLYRDESLRKYQFFIYSQWPGGLCGSPTMAGTRPGLCQLLKYLINTHHHRTVALEIKLRNILNSEILLLVFRFATR